MEKNQKEKPLPEVNVQKPKKADVERVFYKVFGEKRAEYVNLDKTILFRCGSKELLLFLDDNGAYTMLATQQGYDRIPEETKALYLRAKITLEEYTEKIGVPYMYEFNTGNPLLLRWAETTGEEIFHWDTILAGYTIPHQEYKIFFKTFFPKSPELNPVPREEPDR